MKKSTGYYLTAIIIMLNSINGFSQKMRILTGGIRHESNTFSTMLTREANFNVKEGQEALKGQPWADELVKSGVEIIPTLHAYAWPGGVVEKAAFEKYKKAILDGIQNAGKLDGIYLDMHGALHAEGYEDAQLTLIEDIRAIVGNDVLISGSFDLHGNVSPAFVKKLNILTAYRTAPHRDGDSTKVRAVKLLVNAIRKKQKPLIAQVVIPLLIPGEMGTTDVDPFNSLYAKLLSIGSKPGILDASIFIGYAWADVSRAAMSVEVVAEDPRYFEKAREEALKLATDIWEVRNQLKFGMIVAPADQAIDMAVGDTAKTVFISDSGDNTTGGAAGDSPFLLERLLAKNVKDVVYGAIFDSSAVIACEKAGLGKTIELTVGGKIDNVFTKSLKVKGKVIFISPAEARKTDKHAAVIQVDGVTLVLIYKRRSFVSPQDFYNVNIKPLEHKIVVVKLGYLYPELYDIAPKHIMALTPGFCYQDLDKLPYKNIKRPAYPLDKNMSWKALLE